MVSIGNTGINPRKSPVGTLSCDLFFWGTKFCWFSRSAEVFMSGRRQSSSTVHKQYLLRQMMAE